MAIYRNGACGIVTEVGPDGARVKFEEDDGHVSDILPILVRKTLTDKESWQLEINEQVFCMMDDKFDEGIIIGALPNTSDPADPGQAEGKFRKKFSDGTEIEYDKNTSTLTVDVKGEIIGKSTGKTTIEAPNIEATATAEVKLTSPSVKLDSASVSVTGALAVTGALTAASIATTGGGAIAASGNMTVSGSITTTGDVVAAGKSLSTHVHGGVQSGGGTTSPPI